MKTKIPVAPAAPASLPSSRLCLTAALGLTIAWVPARAADIDGTLEARQVVIRAPELEVVAIMADTTTRSTEAARVAALWLAVKEGRARVISDLSSTVVPNEHGNGSIRARQGQHVWLPSELDQDTDRLQMPPLAHQEYFVGTSLETGTPNAPPTIVDWKGECIPRGPALVKWPVSWLRPYVNQKPDPQKRLIRGWLDFHDTFEESTVGTVNLRGTAMQLLAVMPPADQVWPGSRAATGRWLDVFLAQMKNLSARGQEPPAPPPEAEATEDDAAGAEPPPNAGPADPFAPNPGLEKMAFRPQPQGQMSLFYGIGIGAAEAATLIHQREPADDAALLQKLLARVQAGTARLRVCVGSGHHPHSRHVISSVRLHQEPSEMPSIPSAWQERWIGTHLEMDLQTFSLHQDLAPPGRSEWKLAADDPQAVMWQPRPRSLQLTADTPRLHGTHLVGLLHIPEVMRQKDSGLDGPEPESILVFARHQGPAVRVLNDKEHPVFETEVIVLEMPGTSVDDFEGLPGDPLPDEEDERFRQLMGRVKTGEVRVAAHAMATIGRSKAQLRIAEEHKHATEFDPPEDTPRMRPTALQELYAGSEMEIEVQPDPLSPVQMQVQVSFKHSTALPVEPDLPTTLAVAARNESGPYPESRHPQEIWTSSDTRSITGSSGYRVRDNSPYCLSARKPEGVGREVIHVAYLRVRRLFP